MGRADVPNFDAETISQTNGFCGARERRRDKRSLAAAAPQGLTFADDGGLLRARQAPT
jgi:hypothetical protein